MSDPVTNIEIEDVLSSIRRLFKEDNQGADSAEEKAEEKPEKQGDSTSDAATENTSESTDRLVLTPAFRVDPIRKKNAAEAVEAEAESAILTSSSAVDSVDKSVAVEESRLHLMPDEASQDKPDVLVLGAWQAAEPEVDEPATAIQDAPTAVFQTDNLEQVDPIAASQNRQSSLKATIAELEAAISDQGAEFEPDGSEEVGSIPENEPLQWQDSDETDVLEQFIPEAKSEAASEPEPEIIELDNVAPQEVDPAFVRRHAASSDVESDPSAITAPDFPSTEPDTLQEALGRDLPVEQLPIDEDAMRDLVSEIVRQELQGALGERITRNVRKLVRREIHRIISSQEFE